MKARIFSIMDMSKKKAGVAVLCGALVLTLGTGFTLAANAETRTPPQSPKTSTEISPWISVYFLPDANVYAKYAAVGVTISEDGTKLLYEGQSVRMFVDDKSEQETFYLDGDGSLNLSVIRNAAGEITGIERMTEQKAQEYYENFFAEELDPNFIAKVNEEAARDLAEDMAKEGIQEGENKYEKYEPFGLSYSATDNALYFNGQRVKFFIDQPAGEGALAFWTDEAGTVNLAVLRDASGQITGIERITDAKAQEYQSAVDEYNRNALNGLEDEIENRIANSGLEDEIAARIKA